MVSLTPALTAVLTGAAHAPSGHNTQPWKVKVLAADTLLDRDVAFALIKTDGLDDVGRERVRREAQAMGRLGAHPHVVSVFDLGDGRGHGDVQRGPGDGPQASE